MQFWKGYISNCIKNLGWAWGDVTKECMNDICKKTFKRFIFDLKDLPRMKRLQDSTRQWLIWQTTLTLVWMRMT